MARRIGDIIEERAGLVEAMRGILNTAESEQRDLSAEERQEYDGQEERVQELTSDIRRHEQLAAVEAVDLRDPSVEQPDNPEGSRTVGRDSDEYRDAFTAAMRGQEDAEQRSTLNTSTDAEGGFAVPEQWGDLHESLREAGVIRELATVVTTEMGGNLHVPYISADAAQPGPVAEEDPIPDDGETFAEKIIAAYKRARITKASEEVMQDALFDVAGFVGGRLGFDLGRAANAWYVNGDGVGEPEGLFAGATVADTLASATAITGDEIIDLFYSVIRPYRANGVWIAADTTIAAVRKLKDGNGQYLWQPALQAGEPDLLLGKPAYSDPDVDPLGVSNRVLGFGDVKRAYLIRDVLGVTIRLLLERYADTGQVAWRGQLRTGGAIVDQNAFKVADTPAA